MVRGSRWCRRRGWSRWRPCSTGARNHGDWHGRRWHGRRDWHGRRGWSRWRPCSTGARNHCDGMDGVLQPAVPDYDSVLQLHCLPFATLFCSCIACRCSCRFAAWGPVTHHCAMLAEVRPASIWRELAIACVWKNKMEPPGQNTCTVSRGQLMTRSEWQIALYCSTGTADDKE